MGKVVGAILGTLLVIAIVLFLLFKLGVIGFPGKGPGNGGSENNNPAVSSEVQEETGEEETEVVIVAQQDEYYINNQKVTLTEIKEKVTADNVSDVIVEDNYAGTKAMDELLDSLKDWGITPVMR